MSASPVTRRVLGGIWLGAGVATAPALVGAPTPALGGVAEGRCVAVGGTGVLVGGGAAKVGGTGVLVGGTGVLVDVEVGGNVGAGQFGVKGICVTKTLLSTSPVEPAPCSDTDAERTSNSVWPVTTFG